MRLKNVLHLIDTGGPGGAETIFLNVVTGLDPERWRSVAAVPELDWLDAALRERGVQPLLVSTQGSFDLRYLWRLVRLVQREEINLIHAHLLTTGVYGSLVGRLTGVPVICTFHGQADISPDEVYGGIKFRILNRRRNRIVFVSDSLRETFLKATPLGSTETRVVHNGIDVRSFRPGRDDSLRRELGVDEQEILVGAVGNVRPSKDYANFLRAAAELRMRSDVYRFIIVGDTRTPLFSKLLELRRVLGLEDAVEFLGFREDIERVLRALDVYLMTSSAEGFSLSTVQALAVGLPVVATRCGGPEEILQDGASGVLVPPGDPKAIAEAVHALVHDPEQRSRLAQAGPIRAECAFSMDAMVKAYEALYEECVGGCGSAEDGEEQHQPVARAGERGAQLTRREAAWPSFS